MVTLTADVTENIKKITGLLVRKGIYKSQSEVVRDAIRQLAYKYGIEIATINEVRQITKKAAKKTGKNMSQSVRALRDQA